MNNTYKISLKTYCRILKKKLVDFTRFMNIFILVKFNNSFYPVTFDTPIQMNNYVLKRSLILNKQEKINPIKVIYKINVTLSEYYQGS